MIHPSTNTLTRGSRDVRPPWISTAAGGRASGEPVTRPPAGTALRGLSAAVVLFALACGAARAAVVARDLEAAIRESEAAPETAAPWIRQLPRMQAADQLWTLPGLPKPSPPVQDRIQDTLAAITEQPRNMDLVIRLGNLYLEAGAVDQAAEIFWRLARVDTANLAALDGLGFALLSCGDHANGFRIYEKLTQLDPGHADYRFNFAAACYNTGQLEDAESLLRGFLAEHPEDEKALYNMGVVAWARGKHAEALTWLQKSLKARPDSPFALCMMARIYRDSGDTAGMNEALRRASALMAPERVEAVLKDPQVFFYLLREAAE